MRLSKVAKELNVGISNIVVFLSSKGIEIDARPNTKISIEAYDVLKKEFSADFEEHKKSEKIAQARRDEQEAIKAESIKKNLQEQKVIKAKSTITAPKLVGKIDLHSDEKLKSKSSQDKSSQEKNSDKEKSIQDAKIKLDDKVNNDNKKNNLNNDIESSTNSEASSDSVNNSEKNLNQNQENNVPDFSRAKNTLAGPKLTGEVIDLTKFKKPEKKKIASSTNIPGKQNDKKKRKRIFQNVNKASNSKFKNTKNTNNSSKNSLPEPSDEEIQKKIAETLDKLTNKGKSKGAKHRKSKREERKEQDAKEQILADNASKVIKVTEFVTVSELATLMNVQVNEIISTCMMLGIMVTLNQRLDAETLTIVASEFEYDVEFVSAEVQEAIEEFKDDPSNLISRSPIVTVMGHVDHGKTSLLDYIREANVIAGEAGGITQHIGAYDVRLKSGKHITFIDTPGHEAFTAMRARGAQITDIAIIVIAADDKVMPQTKEAISHAQAANVPIVFAINKVDKTTANPDKIKEELSSMNLLVEDWGGKFQSHDVSAKNGLGVEDLLEKVLLEAEILELKANPSRLASGSIIEASLDKGKGFVTTILVQNGTLNLGDFLIAGHFTGKVKAMFNERGVNIDTAGPSSPVSILGLTGAPQAGDNFNVMIDEREAKSIALKRTQLQREQSIRTQKHLTLDEIGRRLALGDFKELNIILKGDVDGSIEALSDSLQKLSTDSIQVNIIHKAVGQISESDILLATASDAIVVGFQVRPSLSARKLAEKEQIDIRLYSIIYDAINEVKEAMEGMLSPDTKENIVCNIEVREIFKISKVGSVAGCYVLDGKINRKSNIRVIRDGVVIYTGVLGSLKRFKDDVKEVSKGYECGLNVEKFNDIKVGDIIEGYEEVEVKRSL
ncbi:MAG: translation initiation factor IF-2 [Flavobacteriales bacterium TMED288]|nr:translation initiation factor IF-2 [Flavobacteriales bacterium]RPG53518.1 MAG: translation initiation factor IF-2 [Flavobacteriales bacterium TMED288]|tara:strand:+ start:15303 stop:17993 length:2691 start_codon:yes stop_codon:yes gene_type:complete